jgi:hypothetical protein
MDEHLAVNLAAEQLRDEGIVARSGDPGVVDEDDPWCTGEIELLERKSLQKELMDRVTRSNDTDYPRSTSLRRRSLERSGSLTSGRFSRPRSSHSQRGTEDAAFATLECDSQRMHDAFTIPSQPLDTSLAVDSSLAAVTLGMSAQSKYHQVFELVLFFSSWLVVENRLILLSRLFDLSEKKRRNDQAFAGLY